MALLSRFADWIDALSDRVGRAVGWLTLVMVLLGAGNAVGRWAGRRLGLSLSSNALLELQWYLFSAVFLLAAGYTLRHGRHVRVDVLYGRLPPRGRAWINLGGTVLFLLPFSIFCLAASWPAVWHSWQAREVSPDPGGLPRYPIKALIPVAFVLLLLQGLAEGIRQLEALTGRRALEEPREAEGGR